LAIFPFSEIGFFLPASSSLSSSSSQSAHLAAKMDGWMDYSSFHPFILGQFPHCPLFPLRAFRAFIVIVALDIGLWTTFHCLWRATNHRINSTFLCPLRIRRFIYVQPMGRGRGELVGGLDDCFFGWDWGPGGQWMGMGWAKNPPPPLPIYIVLDIDTPKFPLSFNWRRLPISPHPPA
jgi:hypothetical protein